MTSPSRNNPLWRCRSTSSLVFLEVDFQRRIREKECVGTMGARRHGQEGEFAPSENVVQRFLHYSSYSKSSIDELFMHHFTTCRRLLGASHRGSIPGPLYGTFAPRPPICPLLEKILLAPMGTSPVTFGSGVQNMSIIWSDRLNVAWELLESVSSLIFSPDPDRRLFVPSVLRRRRIATCRAGESSLGHTLI